MARSDRIGMGKSSFSRKAERYLRHLCEQIGERSVGSAGNQRAAQWIAEVLTGFGFTVARQAFDCIDWSQQGADMRVGEEAFRGAAEPVLARLRHSRADGRRR